MRKITRNTDGAGSGPILGLRPANERRRVKSIQAKYRYLETSMVQCNARLRNALEFIGMPYNAMQYNTVKSVYNDHLTVYSLPSGALGHLDELQKAEIVSKSKLVPAVFTKTHKWISHTQAIKHIIEVVVTDRFHCIIQ